MDAKTLWSVMVVGLVAVAGLAGCQPALTVSGTPTVPGPSPTAGVVAVPTPAPVLSARPTATPEGRAIPTPTLEARATETLLTVEEYTVVASTVAAPDRIEYRQRLDPMVLEKRQEWREQPPQELAARSNEVLSRFGYRLVSSEQPGCPVCVSFRLDRQGNVILTDVAHFGLPVLSERGDDFALLVESRGGRSLLVRKEGATPWKPEEHAHLPPVFLEGDLLYVVRSPLGQYEVRRGDRALYSFTPPQDAIDNPIKGLWAWQGQWVLEVDGRVLVDGKSLNQERGYDEVFGWRLVKGEPFYFFRRGAATGVSYAGQELPYRYEEVVHYRCCEPAAFNVQGNDTMVWFHALRGGTYYYVEMGRYDRPTDRLVEGQGSPGQAGEVPPQIWMGLTVQGENPAERRRLVPGELASVPLPESASAGYEVELAFPKSYDLSRIAVMVDSPGWAFIPNSGAVKPSDTHIAYLFGLRPKGARQPGAVKISVDGVGGPEGTVPLLFSFWAGGR